jgi:hypothetical protein
MTYNFDPDKWYENELYLLEQAFKAGTLKQTEFDAALEKLTKRYEEMLDRLDGTYQI